MPGFLWKQQEAPFWDCYLLKSLIGNSGRDVPKNAGAMAALLERSGNTEGGVSQPKLGWAEPASHFPIEQACVRH